MPDVHVSEYGAVGDGVTDDSVAINAAVTAAAGGEVRFGALEYTVNLNGEYALEIGGEGGHLVGSKGSSAAGTGGTRIKALNAGKGIILIDKSYNVSITGMYLNGDNKAENGVVCYRAAHDVLRDLMIRHCTDSGVLLDMYAKTPNGSNNHLRLERVVCHWNGYGLRTIEGNDNNGINVIACEMGSNSQHGILLKGMQWLIQGGGFEGNGEHAIQISEPGDIGHSMFNVLHNPWIESCGANHIADGTWVNYGYHGGGKSSKNVLYANGQMPFSNAPGSFDVHVSLNQGSSAAYEIRSGFGAGASIRPGYSSVVYASDGTVENIPIYVRPKSAPLHLCDQGQGVTIGDTSTIIKAHTAETAELVGGRYSEEVVFENASLGDVVFVCPLFSTDVKLRGHVKHPGMVMVTTNTLDTIPSGEVRLVLWKY